MNKRKKYLAILLAAVLLVVIGALAVAKNRGDHYLETSPLGGEMRQVRKQFQGLLVKAQEKYDPESDELPRIPESDLREVLARRDRTVDKMRQDLEERGYWAIVIPLRWEKRGDWVDAPDPIVLIFR